MVTRWVFYDPVTLDSYTVPINPNDDGTPGLSKNMRYLNTAGPDGSVLAFEGRDNPKETQVKGIILDEAHLDALEEWSNKRYQVQITDDLGRVYQIYITDFAPRRVRARSHPYKHEYTLSFVIVDW